MYIYMGIHAFDFPLVPRPQMQSLCSSDDAMVILDHMETQYYELQLQLYDIQAEILQCEELLLTAQLDSIRRQMTGTLALFTTALWSILFSTCSNKSCG